MTETSNGPTAAPADRRLDLPHPLDEGAAPRFGGTAPVEHLRGVLSACCESSASEVRGRFLILTHMGPDPDALGACEGLRLLLEKGFGHDCVVATHGKVHRAENVALLETLELDLADYESTDVSGFCGVLLVDTQPAFRHTVVPAAPAVVAVFDHHRSPQSDAGAREIPHEDVRVDLGATSSILFEYLRDAGVALDERTASALFCGIRYGHRRPVEERLSARRGGVHRDLQAGGPPPDRGDRQPAALPQLLPARGPGADDGPPARPADHRAPRAGREPGARRGDGRLLPSDEGLLLGRCGGGVRGVLRALVADRLLVRQGLPPHRARCSETRGPSVVMDTSRVGGSPWRTPGQSAIGSIERRLLKNALAVISASSEDGAEAPDGRRL